MNFQKVVKLYSIPLLQPTHYKNIMLILTLDINIKKMFTNHKTKNNTQITKHQCSTQIFGNVKAMV
jgi:hypothetical protein